MPRWKCPSRFAASKSCCSDERRESKTGKPAHAVTIVPDLSGLFLFFLYLSISTFLDALAAESRPSPEVDPPVPVADEPSLVEEPELEPAAELATETEVEDNEASPAAPEPVMVIPLESDDVSTPVVTQDVKRPETDKSKIYYKDGQSTEGALIANSARRAEIRRQKKEATAAIKEKTGSR
jgi:hypothetical protein